jgi:3-oxocholest-4-en-26-oyl-CoA dehydrogenase beta subunit
VDFGMSETQDMIRSTASEFLEDRCPPTHVRAMERDERGFSDQLWRQIAEMGWLGIPVPGQYGGAGMGFVDLAVLLEETGAAAMPGPFISTAVIGAMALIEAGTEDQRQRFLPPIVSGELTVGFACPSVAVQDLRENGNAPYATAGRAPGADAYVLSGRDFLVPHAGTAGLFLVPARTADGEGISTFLVTPDMPGVIARTALKSVIGAGLSAVSLQDVEVPGSAILGGGGALALSRLLQLGAAATCAEMVGGARRVLDMTVEYVKGRTQFGRPVGSFQAVQHHCADMAIELQGARALARRAAWRLGEGLAAGREVALAKIALNEAFPRICATAHQCHGAIGFTEEHDLQLYTRRSIAARASFGDTAHHEAALARALDLEGA